MLWKQLMLETTHTLMAKNPASPSSARTAARSITAGRASARPAASGTRWSRKTPPARPRAGASRSRRKGRLFALEPLAGESAGRPAPALRHGRARPRHRRRLRARLGAADRRRSRHRQIDAADPGHRRAGARRPPRGLHLRRGGGGAGAAARRAARPCRGAGRARRRNLGRGHRRDACRRARRRASSSSIRSRPCGPTRSNPRPAR